jgi:hypothetical protein
MPLYLFTQGRGWGGVNSEKVIGALVHKRGPKYPHDWPYLQSINYSKHQWWRHLWFGVFTVIWSMELIQDGGKIRRQKGHLSPRSETSTFHLPPSQPPIVSHWALPLTEHTLTLIQEQSQSSSSIPSLMFQLPSAGKNAQSCGKII